MKIKTKGFKYKSAKLVGSICAITALGIVVVCAGTLPTRHVPPGGYCTAWSQGTTTACKSEQGFCNPVVAWDFGYTWYFLQSCCYNADGTLKQYLYCLVSGNIKWWMLRHSSRSRLSAVLPV